LLNILKKNKEEYTEVIAKVLYENLFYTYQKRIFKEKPANYSSISINTDVRTYPTVIFNKNRNKLIKFVREKENRISTIKKANYSCRQSDVEIIQDNKTSEVKNANYSSRQSDIEIVRDDKYIWDQIDFLENKIEDLNTPVLEKNKTK